MGIRSSTDASSTLRPVNGSTSGGNGVTTSAAGVTVAARVAVARGVAVAVGGTGVAVAEGSGVRVAVGVASGAEAAHPVASTANVKRMRQIMAKRFSMDSSRKTANSSQLSANGIVWVTLNADS